MTSPHPPALPLVDLVLRGGRISTFAAPDEGPEEVEALAIAGGRVVAIGTDAQLAPYAEIAARVVDLDGRRALPGLNDSHIHAVRGGVSWDLTMHWEDVRSIPEALERVRAEAQRRGPGRWVSAIGGWHSTQLAEGRAPTRAELDEAAPDNPVYVQELYDRGILNTAGLRAAGFPDGTGELHGVREFAVPTALALAGGETDATDGVRAMNAVFAGHGLTGVVDGGGLFVSPRDYDPLYAVWRRGELDVRTRLYVSAWTRGGEVADIDRLTTLVQPGSGDAMLKVVGVGEIPHLGCHDMEGFDPFEIDDTSYAELVEIVRMCVARGWRMSVHAVLDSSLTRILDAWEEVQAETGRVGGAGFSIVHADGASRANLERLARLNAGVLVQSRLVLKGGDYASAWGSEVTASAPPIGQMQELGIVIGAGTDATRANWFSPWASIWWLVTGGTLDGRGARAPRHRMARTEALVAYTRDAAWFTGEQAHRGQLLPGFDGDVCVPTLDPLACTDDELRDIRSDLTVLGGRITFDSGALEREAPAEPGKDASR
ncbi:amidohydrolase [Microbacterium sp. RD1]|uniref:amidohydrolase n=1 Tax=Microbacterium sp. RD1 TaxID=3457313 RepID=UPI003FA5BBEE